LDERLHGSRSLVISVFKSSNTCEAFGYTDQEVCRDLYPYTDRQDTGAFSIWVIILTTVMSAGARLIDVVLKNGRVDLYAKKKRKQESEPWKQSLLGISSISP